MMNAPALNTAPFCSALEAFRAASVEHDRMIAGASSSEDLAAWEALRAADFEPVREAFYQMTAHVNSRERCQLFTVNDAFALEKSFRAPLQPVPAVPIERRVERHW